MLFRSRSTTQQNLPVLDYVDDPIQGNAILAREGISVTSGDWGHAPSDHPWLGWKDDLACPGDTPLIAGLRAHVTHTLGRTIDVPSDIAFLQLHGRTPAFITESAPVLWLDPDNHSSTGLYAVAEIDCEEEGFIDPQDRIRLRDADGDDGVEVPASELRDPATHAFQWAFVTDSAAFEPDENTPNQRNMEIAQVIQYAADDIEHDGLGYSLGVQALRDSNGSAVGTFSIVSTTAPSPGDAQVIIRMPVNTAISAQGTLDGSLLIDALTNLSRDIIKSPNFYTTGERPDGLQFNIPVVGPSPVLNAQDEPGLRYDHVFELGFTVFASRHPEAEDVTPASMRAAIQHRLNSMSNAEILEAIGLPIESYPVRPAPMDTDLSPA